jgi:ABC-type enterobactin transport system permease subunit
MNIFAIGAIVNGALYLVAVFVAGLLTGHIGSMRLAIVTLGLAYLSHLIAYMLGRAEKRALVEGKIASNGYLAMVAIQRVIVGTSILCGVFALLLLI